MEQEEQSIKPLHTGHQIDMLHGSLLDKILLFALPLAASSILQQLFNSADVAVVGRFAGNTAQAAVGSSSPLINLFINFFTGLSIGTNAVIARQIGQGEKDKIQKSVHTSVALALVSVQLIFCRYSQCPFESAAGNCVSSRRGWRCDCDRDFECPECSSCDLVSDDRETTVSIQAPKPLSG